MTKRIAEKLRDEVNALNSSYTAQIVEVETKYHPDHPCALRIDYKNTEVGYAGNAHDAEYLVRQLQRQVAADAV